MSMLLHSAGALDLPPRAEPFVAALARRTRGVWRLLLAPGRHRDGTQPATAIAEAAQVRALAWRVGDGQPGFASDLLAAADRHERQFGVDR